MIIIEIIAIIKHFMGKLKIDSSAITAVLSIPFPFSVTLCCFECSVATESSALEIDKPRETILWKNSFKLRIFKSC